MNNIWKDFAELHGMSPNEFASEILTVAQAILPIQLNEHGAQSMRLESEQLGKKYRLVFQRLRRIEYEGVNAKRNRNEPV